MWRTDCTAAGGSGVARVNSDWRCACSSRDRRCYRQTSYGHDRDSHKARYVSQRYAEVARVLVRDGYWPDDVQRHFISRVEEVPGDTQGQLQLRRLRKCDEVVRNAASGRSAQLLRRRSHGRMVPHQRTANPRTLHFLGYRQIRPGVGQGAGRQETAQHSGSSRRRTAETLSRQGGRVRCEQRNDPHELLRQAPGRGDPRQDVPMGSPRGPQGDPLRQRLRHHQRATRAEVRQAYRKTHCGRGSGRRDRRAGALRPPGRHSARKENTRLAGEVQASDQGHRVRYQHVRRRRQSRRPRRLLPNVLRPPGRRGDPHVGLLGRAPLAPQSGPMETRLHPDAGGKGISQAGLRNMVDAMEWKSRCDRALRSARLLRAPYRADRRRVQRDQPPPRGGQSRTRRLQGHRFEFRIPAGTPSRRRRVRGSFA